MSARPKVCDVTGCRKHVRVVVGVRVLFAHQVNMRGPDKPLYREKHFFRCGDHTDAALPGDHLGTLPIAVYDAKVAELNPAEGGLV